jgi:hypothetical protein
MLAGVRIWHFLGLLVAGCTTTEDVQGLVRPRAAFDLNCPDVQIVPIEGGASGTATYGATGCGRRARYETRCSLAGTNCVIHTGSIADTPASSASGMPSGPPSAPRCCTTHTFPCGACPP